MFQTNPSGIRSINRLELTSNGTYTPPQNLVGADVEMVGGGGGAAAFSSSSANKTGGAAGGYCKRYYTLAQLLPSVSYTIGTGGAVDTAGTASTFLSMTASGGQAGRNQITISNVAVCGEGGDATGGQINIRGASAQTTGNTSGAWQATSGASSMLGKGGATGANGVAGERGSGGGAANNGTSAAGGNGIIIITEYLR